MIGGFYTIILYPDGSKEKYELSDNMDLVREKLLEYLKDMSNVRYCLMEY